MSARFRWWRRRMRQAAWAMDVICISLFLAMGGAAVVLLARLLVGV